MMVETVLAEKIGKALATMHSLDIIHGDLTTSNMLLREGSESLVSPAPALEYENMIS